MSIVVKVRASTDVVTIKRMKFSGNHTVYDIKKAYCDEHNNAKAPEKITFRYKGKELKPDSATLSSVGIKGRMVMVSMSSKLRGGALYAPNVGNILNNKRKRRLNKSDSEIKISNKACCVYLDRNGDRAEMPCGHAFSPQSMFDTLKAVITRNEYEYTPRCPACSTEMDLDLCAKIADLNDTEYEYFLVEFDRRASPETKACPDCKIDCERPDNLKMFRVNCTSCSGGDWCFLCAQKWKKSGFTVCGNQNCALYDINEILMQCPMKKAYDVNVPELRACPNCLEFIEHEEACKHMKCEKCAHEFCFACLKPKNKDGSWPCGSYSNQCNVAPRQQF